jgi:LytS/YehU family sensor histidine kinase
VDPHFLFNSLHALVHLVETRSPHAVPFTQALAESYRYVLETRDRPLVALPCELAALERHHLLTSFRYGPRVSLTVDVAPDLAAHISITPVTLPELLTNAAKHNDGTAENPVPVTVRLEGDCLVMENARRPRITTEPSTATGLDNLAARCQHAIGRPLRVTETAEVFRVDVPVVRN